MNIKFVEKTKTWVSISIVIIIIGIIFTIFNGLNMGVDFAGGSSIEIDFQADYDVEALRDLVHEYATDATVLTAGDNGQSAIIRIKAMEDEVNVQKQIVDAIKEEYGVTEDTINIEYVGATLGKEIIRNAWLSVLAACVLMLLYIWIRFEIQSGVAAVIALVHDVLIIFAVISIFKIQINSPFVAAILTIIGYSINDTIVVFDRIRENNKRFGGHMTKGEVVNKSINETIVRTLNTSATTLIMVALLFALGVPSIKEFSLPILVGIISGTYSSIFIASPIWAAWSKKKSEKK